ncbi:MAG TPA: OmpA family protein [Chitinophagales bacterium]|nr:OmpA family protein [Chitinophagales bacterium]
MRNIIQLFAALIVAVFFTTNTNAQSALHPWLIGAGINAVDLHGPDSTKDILKTEFWNTMPAIAHLSLGLNLNPSLAVDLQLSGARITHAADGSTVSGRGFYAGDIDLRYKFDNGYIINENAWIAPYLFVGAGVNYMDKDKTRPNAGGGIGLNLWIWKDLGIYGQSAYRWSSDDHTYIEHTAGIIVRFGMHDADGDGISDEEDACPNEAGPLSTHGCPDKDGDGVPDKMDACPDVAGLASLNGCPDADGDGIADKDDQCPKEKGTKELQGCPDRDGDGIADKDDQCPDQKGLKQFNGCPDTDGDGIPDKTDQCPTQKGLPALQGCPDRDNDGVADAKDRCPDEAGPASNGGCPIPKEEEIQKINMAAKAIQYKTASAEIQKKSYPVLDEIVVFMKQYPQTKWEIEGHTDDVGKDAYNLDLSDRRAASVKNYFISKGISADRLTSHGYGETRPIADNKTAAGKAQNRRTEIHLVQQQ